MGDRTDFDVGNYNDAIENYVSALEFNPDHINAQNNLIHLINFFNPKKFKNNSIIKANNEIAINVGINTSILFTRYFNISLDLRRWSHILIALFEQEIM